MLKLKELRKLRKISQKELANQLGFAQNTLSQYETGMHQPDNVTLMKIAEFFDVSVDYLLGKNDNKEINNKEKTNNKVNELLPDIDDLTPENKEDLRKYYELLKIKQKVDENNNAKTSSSLSENA